MAGIGVIRESGESAPDLAGYVLGERAREGRPLPELAVDLASRSLDAIVVQGDGPARHRAISALALAHGGRPLPPLLPLPAPTRASDPAPRFARLVHAWHHGEALPLRELDTVQVGERVGFVFGTGLVVGFLEALSKRPGHGHGKAAWLLLRAALSGLSSGALAHSLFEPSRTRVSADGEIWPTERFSALLAGTVPRLPLGFAPFHRAGELPRSFHLVGVACAPGRLVPELARVRFGRPIDANKAIDAVAREAVLASDRPLPFALDGAVYEGEEQLRLTVGPRLRILDLP